MTGQFTSTLGLHCAGQRQQFGLEVIESKLFIVERTPFCKGIFTVKKRHA